MIAGVGFVEPYPYVDSRERQRCICYPTCKKGTPRLSFRGITVRFRHEKFYKDACAVLFYGNIPYVEANHISLAFVSCKKHGHIIDTLQEALSLWMSLGNLRGDLNRFGDPIHAPDAVDLFPIIRRIITGAGPDVSALLDARRAELAMQKQQEG